MDECIFKMETNTQEIAFLENVRRQLGFSNLNDFVKFCLKITIDIITYPNIEQLKKEVGLVSLNDFLRYCIKTVELDLKNKKEVKASDSKRGAKSG